MVLLEVLGAKNVTSIRARSAANIFHCFLSSYHALQCRFSSKRIPQGRLKSHLRTVICGGLDYAAYPKRTYYRHYNYPTGSPRSARQSEDMLKSQFDFIVFLQTNIIQYGYRCCRQLNQHTHCFMPSTSCTRACISLQPGSHRVIDKVVTMWM